MSRKRYLNLIKKMDKLSKKLEIKEMYPTREKALKRKSKFIKLKKKIMKAYKK